MPNSGLDRFARIEQLFQQAGDMPTVERSAFLDVACDDTELRREVAGLLQASGEAAENPAWAEGALASEARLTAEHEDAIAFERYRLLGRIGAGGMGVVYKAIRSDEDMPQTVAIKILQGMPGDTVGRARFIQERRILARLEHPNIARLMDGGSTPEGLPFIVMEYVDGVMLSKYLAKAGLNERGILTLFLKICGAVGYAHRQLIAHRDLKPGNILVTTTGEPKLLDFGIATLSDGSAIRTRTGAGALTPGYSSPEQIRGEHAGAASDIYTLGVLLFEMLTGKLPYKPVTSPVALANAISTEQPLFLNSCGKRFDTDLDNIVRMAMRKEPARRYQTVEQLAADIDRYLDGYPVSARKDTAGYRTRKFVQRNHLTLAGCVLIFSSIAGGISATWQQAAIANRRFADLRSMANAFMFGINDAISELPGATPARRMILQRGLLYLSRLSAERADDRKLSLELVDGYQKMVLLQRLSQVNLGDISGALDSEKRSEAILVSLLAESPKDREANARLAGVYSGMTQLLTAEGKLDGAEAYARKSIALNEKLLAPNPEDKALQEALSDSYESLADVTGNPAYQNLGDTATALANYKKCLAMLSHLAAGNPGHIDLLQPVAGVFTRLGKIYLLKKGDVAAALAQFEAAALLSEFIRNNSPRNPWREMDAAIKSTNLMVPLAATGRTEEALSRGRAAEEILTAVLHADTQIAQAHSDLAMVHLARGRVEAMAGHWAGAIVSYRRALEIFGRIQAAEPQSFADVGYQSTLRYLADAELESGDVVGSLLSARKELDLDNRLLAQCRLNAGAAENQAIAEEQSGRAYEKAGKRDEAMESYQRALTLFVNCRKSGRLSAAGEPEIERLRGITEVVSAHSSELWPRR